MIFQPKKEEEEKTTTNAPSKIMKFQFEQSETGNDV